MGDYIVAALLIAFFMWICNILSKAFTGEGLKLSTKVLFVLSGVLGWWSNYW